MNVTRLFFFTTVTLLLILLGCGSATGNETSVPQVTNTRPAPTEVIEKTEFDPMKPTVDIDVNSNSPSEPTEIPVQPSPNQYQITIEVHPSGAGTVTAEPSGDTLNEGTEVTLLTSAGIGFSFDHWLVDGQSSRNISSITLSSNKAIDAYFIPNVQKLIAPVVKDYIDNKNEIVLIDVRSIEDYRKDHIPGAISIPSDSIKSRWNEIPPDKIAFVYASCIT